MKDYTEIDYRDIAKMLASALPVEGEEYRAVVEDYLASIRNMPAAARLALKNAYWFSRRVPRSEREDFFQDMSLQLLRLKTTDAPLAYSIARCDWVDWWKAYQHREHISLDALAERDGPDGESTLAEHMVGVVEYQTRIDGDLDGQALWAQLPEEVKELVLKRLQGKPLVSTRKRGRPKLDAILNNTERSRLNRFAHSPAGHKLLLEATA